MSYYTVWSFQPPKGSLMAIMGSSGAGKSTLMNILTRRNIQGLKIDGEITVNGVRVKEDISKISGKFSNWHFCYLWLARIIGHLIGREPNWKPSSLYSTKWCFRWCLNSRRTFISSIKGKILRVTVKGSTWNEYMFSLMSHLTHVNSLFSQAKSYVLIWF